jgi:ferric-dicitrate binding protein FerR (iron transport regulator)
MEMFSHIESKIKGPKQEVQNSSFHVKNKTSFPFLKLAASFLIFSVLASIIYLYLIREQKTVIQTAYGETKTIVLPDQSQVTLNGNSQISFYPEWEDQKEREVWMTGEVFFDVVHTPSHKRFLVNTSEDFAIEVLGTTFNVNARSIRTRVVLNSGKIKLNIKDNIGKELVMAPGEMVEFEDNPNQYKIGKVRAEVFSSWKNNKLIFDNTPISEICLLIKETYGMEVQVKNKALLDHQVSGSVPNNNLKNLLFGLSESLDLEVKIEEDHITINSK